MSQRIFEEEKSVENQAGENSRNAAIKNHKNKSTSFKNMKTNGEYNVMKKLNHHKSMSTSNAIKFMSNFQTVS